MKLKTTLTIFFAFALIYSSKKHDAKKDDAKQQVTKVIGKKKFPTGSNLSPSDCDVNSFITDQTLSDENYTVDVVSNYFNIEFLTSSEEVLFGNIEEEKTYFEYQKYNPCLLHKLG